MTGTWQLTLQLPMLEFMTTARLLHRKPKRPYYQLLSSVVVKWQDKIELPSLPSPNPCFHSPTILCPSWAAWFVFWNFLINNFLFCKKMHSFIHLRNTVKGVGWNYKRWTNNAFNCVNKDGVVSLIMAYQP